MEDGIDFEQLERELQKVIDADVRYWQQNEAKLRAVSQRVPTYDDFREMVKAAHLKPLEKEDCVKILPTSLWNSSAQNRQGVEINTNDKSRKTQVSETPSSSHQFAREWKIKDDDGRMTFLRELGCDVISALHRNELGYDLMGDVIRVLRLKMDDHDDVLAIRLLRMMSESKRFQLDLQFLSKVEKESCRDLLRRLRNITREKKKIFAENGIEDDDVEQIIKRYDTTYE